MWYPGCQTICFLLSFWWLHSAPGASTVFDLDHYQPRARNISADCLTKSLKPQPRLCTPWFQISIGAWMLKTATAGFRINTSSPRSPQKTAQRNPSRLGPLRRLHWLLLADHGMEVRRHKDVAHHHREVWQGAPVSFAAHIGDVEAL